MRALVLPLKFAEWLGEHPTCIQQFEIYIADVFSDLSLGKDKWLLKVSCTKIVRTCLWSGDKQQLLHCSGTIILSCYVKRGDNSCQHNTTRQKQKFEQRLKGPIWSGASLSKYGTIFVLEGDPKYEKLDQLQRASNFLVNWIEGRSKLSTTSYGLHPSNADQILDLFTEYMFSYNY